MLWAEMPWWGACNEYPLHYVVTENKKNINFFGSEKPLSGAMNKYLFKGILFF